MRTWAVITADIPDKMKIELNGFPMIRMAVQSAKNGGAEKVFVITDDLSEHIAELLNDMGTEIVFSPLSDKRDLFSFVRLGIVKDNCDAVFVFSGSMPMVGPKVFRALEQAAQSSQEVLVVPRFDGHTGYPVLIKKQAFSTLLACSGAEAKKNIMEIISKKYVDVADLGILADADTSYSMEEMQLLARRRRGIAPKLWDVLYDEAELPEHIRTHCRAVGALAAEMAENLIKAGYRLDVELCRSGGALHDILRLEKYHPLVGARFLRDREYWAVSSIVAAHNDFDGTENPDFDEGTIVCLTDKLLKEDIRVNLDTRYFQALEMFSPDTELGARIRQDEETCRMLIRRYKELTGIELE